MRQHLQDTALKRTAKRAARVCRYYRELFGAAGLDPSKLSTATISQLPLTSKPDVLSRPADFIADGSSPFLSTRSTGTTGQPVTVWMSRYEAELWPALAALARLLRGEITEADSMQVNVSSRATAAVQQNINLCRLAGATCHMLGLIPALRIQGSWRGGGWTGDRVQARSSSSNGHPAPAPPGTFTESDGTFTVTGSGDIAPAVGASSSGGTVGVILTGAFPALIAVIVVGTLFITAEYRDRMVLVTLAASSRRGRVLAAKAIVLGALTFATGLAGAVVAVPLGERLARENGVYLFPVTFATQLRVEAGTAALLATASILALAVGTMVRRSAGAVTTVIAAIVLPYLLVAQIPFIPASVSDWLARVTPAAAFAVQQTLVQYHQVASLYTPYDGYYPLAPWAGFTVLAGYAILALAVAAVLLRRRDA